MIIGPASLTVPPPPVQHAQAYESAYRAVARRYGPRTPGRNILRWGLPSGRRVTAARLTASLRVLQGMLRPRPAVASSTPVAPAPSQVSSAPSSGYASSGYAIPAYIVMCESGGDWSAVNPTSGAGGAYQIMPATWLAYGGTGLPQDASPAEQSAIAAKIWAAVGPSAWSCA